MKVQVAGNCRVNNSGVLLQLALAGAGIVLSPTYVLGPHIKDGTLKQILPDSVAFPDMSLYATYMPNRYMQPKVRAFIDHLIEHFGRGCVKTHQAVKNYQIKCQPCKQNSTSSVL